MKKRRYNLTKEKYLHDDEHDKLERRLKSLIPHEPRNAALILTAMYTGARAQEVLNIRPKDLDPRDRTVFIRGLKGSDDREIPLPDWLFKLLLLQLPQEKNLFPISYQRLDQIWCSLRTVDKKFHALRHTFALRLYRRTKDIHLVKVALGHRQISNTMVYVNYDYSTTEMRKLLIG